MFKATAKTTALSALAAAIFVTTLATNPAHAGGGRDPVQKVSTISSTNPDGSTTAIRSVNGAKSYTVTRSKNGQVVSKKTVKKKRPSFITIFNPDGTSRTIVGAPRRSKIPFVTIHNPDGTSHTIAGNR